MRGIVCIGDSLTAGFGGGGTSYPAELERLLNQEQICGQRKGRTIRVTNLGVNGEDSVTILGRTGAVPFRLREEVWLGDPGYPKEVELFSPLGAEICPLLYGNAGLERIFVCDEEGREYGGRLTREGGYFCGERYCLRLDADFPGKGGEQKRGIHIPKGSALTTQAAREYRSDFPIILMGANGSFESAEDLIGQHRMLIDWYHADQGQYLVLGLPFGTGAEMREWEQSFEAAFGDSYLNVREEMSQHGFTLAGMPEKEDLAASREGRIPEGLLFDGLHFNSSGYRALGQLVFQRLQEKRCFE